MSIATNTAPSAWADEDDETIATAIDIIEKRAEAMKRG